LAQPDSFGDLELDSSPAWLSERRDTRRLLFDYLTFQDAINELDDDPLQLPQSVEI